MREAKFVHALTNLLCDALCLIRCAAFKNNRKFVAPKSSYGVSSANRFAYEFADLLQHLIAGRVTTGIVNQLELVQVNEQQCIFSVLVARRLQHSAQSRFEFGAINQTGQCVMSRAIL